MPPAHTENYDGPHPDWLRDLIISLPRLQSLIVDQLPFFDHSALLELRYWGKASNSQLPSFPLALLSAEGCRNATYIGLSEALERFRSLVFLNLSGLPAARSQAVLLQLSRLQHLQVLRLGYIGLDDGDLETIARNVSLQLRCLDVRHNRLTDASTVSLATHCFKTVSPQTTEHASVPSLSTDQHRHSLVQVQDENFEEHLYRRLVDGNSDYLCDVGHTSTGITHLHVTGNYLTQKGISTLIQTSCLRVLDAGDIMIQGKYREAAPVGQDEIPENGSETLIPLLSEYVSSRMRYLRIHHSLVTAIPPYQAQIVSDQMNFDPNTNDSEIYGMTSKDLTTTQSYNATRNTSSKVSGKSYLELVNDRKHRFNRGKMSAHALLPTMMSNLRSLVLTGVPQLSASPEIHSRIIDLVKACADELHLARKEARASYACPPGRARRVYEMDCVKSIFALERIVLEMEDTKARHSRRAPASWRVEPAYSATEDPDSEAYWAVAQHDFSFFANEEPESTVLNNKNVRWTSGAPSLAECHDESTSPESKRLEAEDRDSKKPLFDVISEISKFRRERRIAFVSLRSQSPDATFVEGYWDGAIQVVRPGASEGS
ncbi:MAG: hypothetical protein M1831_007182 [Alyxoria varia]|nr:MAG: hypothetical protein M1831_007182 [Alyxoria varia]